jgi:hypothetical protein
MGISHNLMKKPVVYDCQPIGVDGFMEAVHVRYFCSLLCRSSVPDEDETQYGLDGDWPAGTVCEKCGIVLQPSNIRPQGHWAVGIYERSPDGYVWHFVRQTDRQGAEMAREGRGIATLIITPIDGVFPEFLDYFTIR